MIGLKQGQVKLEKYSQDWPAQYAREAAGVTRALGDRVLEIQHIGSTAVPGMDAKPIVDIALRIASLTDIPACTEALGKIGYEYKGEYGLPGRHFFTKGNPTQFHLHIVEEGSDHWRVWVKFRDVLRTDEKIRGEYNDLKRAMARKFASNRDAYTAAKNPFISRILKLGESA